MGVAYSVLDDNFVVACTTTLLRVSNLNLFVATPTYRAIRVTVDKIDYEMVGDVVRSKYKITPSMRSNDIEALDAIVFSEVSKYVHGPVISVEFDDCYWCYADGNTVVSSRPDSMISISASYEESGHMSLTAMVTFTLHIEAVLGDNRPSIVRYKMHHMHIENNTLHSW